MLPKKILLFFNFFDARPEKLPRTVKASWPGSTIDHTHMPADAVQVNVQLASRAN